MTCKRQITTAKRCSIIVYDGTRFIPIAATMELRTFMAAKRRDFFLVDVI